MSKQIDAPGTVAHEVMQLLRARFKSSGGFSGEIAHVRLSQATGRAIGSLHESLRAAHGAGLLTRTERGNTCFWSLGPNAEDVRCEVEATDSTNDARKVLQVDAAVATSVFAYADQRGAAPFSVAMHTDGRMGIERNGRLVCELTNDERLRLLDIADTGVAAP